MIKQYTKSQIKDFLCDICRGETIEDMKKAARTIVDVSKYVVSKYPDMDIYDVENKIIKNLEKYNFGECGLDYIRRLDELEGEIISSSGTILKLIIDDNYVDILLKCFLFYNKEGESHFKETRNIIILLPDFSPELINNISSDLYTNEILFLLGLVKDIDMNMKIYEQINRQNYPNIIKQIIGNSEIEIKLFELIYSYFGMLQYVNPYDIYKIMIKYKDNKNIIEYSSKSAEEVIKCVGLGIYNLDNIVDHIWNITHIKSVDILSSYIDNDISILFAYNSPNLSLEEFFKFVKKEITLSKVKSIFNSSNYDSISVYVEKIIWYIYRIYKENKSFAEIVIDKIFKKDRDSFYSLYPLIKAYDHLFDDIISAGSYSSSDLNNFLISLLDLDRKEIMPYFNFFTSLFKFESDILRFIEIKEHSPIFKINNKIINFMNSMKYSDRVKNRKEILTYILMFLINKNNLEQSNIFFNRLNRYFKLFVNKDVIFNDELMELMYLGSEKEIKAITKI